MNLERVNNNPRAINLRAINTKDRLTTLVGLGVRLEIDYRGIEAEIAFNLTKKFLAIFEEYDLEWNKAHDSRTTS